MSSNLSHRLTDEIKQDIMSGAFEPGARLKTEVLADRYNVSANPVREALWRLQGEGFVVTTPNHGARVRVIDADFIRNIFELREIIEPVFVRRFCLRASSHALYRLEAEQGRFIKQDDQDPRAFYRLDGGTQEVN